MVTAVTTDSIIAGVTTIANRVVNTVIVRLQLGNLGIHRLELGASKALSSTVDIGKDSIALLALITWEDHHCSSIMNLV